MRELTLEEFLWNFNPGATDAELRSVYSTPGARHVVISERGEKFEVVDWNDDSHITVATATMDRQFHDVEKLVEFISTYHLE